MSRRGGRNNLPLFHRQATALINSRAMRNFLSRQRFQIVPPGRYRRSRINGTRRYASASQRDRNSTSRNRGNSRRRNGRRRRTRRSQLQAELPERNITVSPMDLLEAFGAVISWCRDPTSVLVQVETAEGNLNFIFAQDDQDTEDANVQGSDEIADDQETDQDANDQNPRQEVRGPNENTNDQNPRREVRGSNENTNNHNPRQEVRGSNGNTNDHNPRQDVLGSNGNTNDQNPRQEVRGSNENTNDQNPRREVRGSDNSNNQDDH
ncbi:uncharacterized protein DDB_G0287625-like [Drosophila subpulchrella]|uniref:uncharacterized protein DDB_G0287625-like n=1 Tax=Drosophila subpulchrella TaxID=1486046 RepID=UPI0018A15E72|nr:uncharacterized protein DDB_G0287625-like [Drosophila subpulchrella]